MGRLKYRTSYGQNVLAHSAEVARLRASWRRKSGSTRKSPSARRSWHDIGKAIDREMEGHASADRHRLPAQARRERGGRDGDGRAPHGHRLALARSDDRAGGGRDLGGASRSAPRHPRVLREAAREARGIADSFKGVSKSFALQAGREIRIMVESEKISDEEAVWLSKDIARRIENELEYPGQIKVTVIRETRAVDYAK